MLCEIVKPEPDSQFRLVPCPCGGEPVYQHFIGEEVPVNHWAVSCPKCKRGTMKYYQARHDAQIEWNTTIKFGLKQQGG